MMGSDWYKVWNTDSSANYASSAIGVVSGSDAAWHSLYACFLMGRTGGAILFAYTTLFRSAFGSTSLVEVGNNFYLNSISSGSGPSLKYAGAAFASSGQVGTWTQIGRAQA